MKKTKRVLSILFLLSTLLLLSGCGGGGSTTTVIKEIPAAPSIVSGSVIDGYISGANVCLDTNINGVCDTGESTTTTAADGSYRFSNLSLSLNSLIPIIVTGGIDTATSNLFEGEIKTIINTNMISDSSITYVSPITDLYTASYIESITQDETTLTSIKEKLASTLGLSIDQLDTNPLSDIVVYSKVQQIEQLKKLVRISAIKSLNHELSDSDNINITKAIAKDIQTNGLFNISNILARIETNLFISIPSNEKTFITEQSNEINERLTELATNYTTETINLDHIQNALEQELEDVRLKIFEATSSNISKIDISDISTLETTGASLQTNKVPSFTTTTNTLTVDENTLVKILVEANDVNNDTITYSLGGVDKAYFTIDNSNGNITSTQIFDYEAPLDYGTNNTYNLIVIASDSKEKSFFNLEIVISNIEETSTLPLQINGFAVDGYLSGSTVCIDTNINGICNTNEDSTTTLNDGSFSFKDITLDLNKLIPIIVIGGIDTATSNLFEGEIKTIINTNTIKDSDVIYISPITDLYTTSFFQSITNNQSTLNNIKQKISTTLGISIDKLDTNTLTDNILFEESIELQSIIYLLVEVSGANLSKTLNSDEIKIIKETILKDIEDNNSLNLTNILTTLEVQLSLNLSSFEKNFVDEQTTKIRNITGNISDNTSLNSNTNPRLKDAFFAELQDITIPLKENKNNASLTTVTISSIDQLLTYANNIKGNNPPIFTMSENTVSDVENKEFKYLLTANDEDNDSITYTLHGVDKDYFTINDKDEITSANIPSTFFDFEEKLDFDKNNIYKVLIEADDGKEKSYYEFNIKITDLDENDPIFNIPNVIEIEEQQDYVIQADTFDESNVTYYLSDADDGLKFNIDSSSGEIRHRTSTNNGVKIDLPDIDDGRRLYVINIYAEDELDNVTEHVLNIRIKQKPRTAIFDKVDELDDFVINGSLFYIEDGATGTDICRTISARGTFESDTNTIVVDPKVTEPTYINADTTLERFIVKTGENVFYTPSQNINNKGNTGNEGTVTLCILEGIADKDEKEFHEFTVIAYTKDLVTDLIYENRKKYAFQIID